MKNIFLPDYVTTILNALEAAGYEAYAVGGAVRDSLQGGVPEDWDLCTAAFPEEVMEVFEGWKTIPTGLQHGTVTVLSEGHPVEITTFRADGEYSDSRHPDQVQFVRSLREDLARRDFTVNAMACSVRGEILDYYGGAEDLRKGILRCVGDPARRFTEDALRIMRALRFMATKGLQADPATAEAIHLCRDGLKQISWERIDAELMKFLAGRDTAALLDAYRDVFAVIIPELERMFDFDQHSPYHNRDVWHHSLAAVDYIEPDPELRLTMLLHDIAKPVVAVFDETGRGHFPGHPGEGTKIARQILLRMKFPKTTVKRVTTLIRDHDTRFGSNRTLVRKLLRDMGEETIRDLMKVQRADAAGKYEKYLPATEKRIRGVLHTLDEILKDGDCCSLRDLAVSGDDLREIGMTEGRAVGETLQKLLEEVIEDLLPNEREALLDTVMEWNTHA